MSPEEVVDRTEQEFGPAVLKIGQLLAEGQAAKEELEVLKSVLALVLRKTNKGRSFTITPRERKELSEERYALQTKDHADGSVSLKAVYVEADS